MELRHLATFKAIADLGGFTKAAEHLGYAQSTVTTHVQALEGEVGAPLFDRLGKKIFLTQTGEQFMPFAIEMLHLYANAKNIYTDSHIPTGTITIAAPESLTVYRLPPILKEYTYLYPQVQLILKPSYSNAEALRLLRTGEHDLVFLLDKEFSEPDLYVEKLVHEPLTLIAPPHLHNNLWSSLLEVITHSTFLSTQQGCSYRKLFDSYLQAHDVVPKASLEFWSIEAIKQSVMCGLGLSILPYFSTAMEMKEKKMAGIVWDNGNSLYTQLAFHNNKWQSVAFKMFLRLVRKHSAVWEKQQI
ncbi:LysR family transcriptional regulator [Bacillus horti]|uniref:DNA-binding transcriptional LysR family regulator n=1 Tax=Caldalkalibacillus horti TaxID=77523 RepID=A0ABT9VYE5_9BACI|nr:LysR family transcriptional regulator [Bacillus horti]MDQ0165890.1 DNA-binding transcriptional LysR family regulator [Bacillus horti]